MRPTATIESVPPIASLRLEGQPSGTEGQRCAEGERHDHRSCDAGPELGEQVTALGLDEVRHKDADDESGFEALAEADEEVRKHGADLSSLEHRFG